MPRVPSANGQRLTAIQLDINLLQRMSPIDVFAQTLLAMPSHKLLSSSLQKMCGNHVNVCLSRGLGSSAKDRIHVGLGTSWRPLDEISI